jgi:2-oxoglutarate ferredoxin oxidoreductase subunit gamma
LENTILIGGIGGQGILVFGQLLCQTALETTDKYITYFPSYSMEKRGGTSDCYVTLSDEPVGSPKAEKSDYVVIFANQALKKFEDALYPGGALFIDTSVCTEKPNRTDVHIVEVPAGEIAREIGDARVANLCMLGAFIGYTEILPPDKVLATALKKIGAKRPELRALNEEAFNKGMEIGTAAKAAHV